MVLLRNEPVEGSPVLPLDPAIALDRGDRPPRRRRQHGRPRVVAACAHRPPCHPIDGIRAAYPNATITLVAEDDIAAAVAAAAAAEVAIVIAGYTAEDEGEYLGEGDEQPRALGALPTAAP